MTPNEARKEVRTQRSRLDERFYQATTPTDIRKGKIAVVGYTIAVANYMLAAETYMLELEAEIRCLKQKLNHQLKGNPMTAEHQIADMLGITLEELAERPLSPEAQADINHINRQATNEPKPNRN